MNVNGVNATNGTDYAAYAPSTKPATETKADTKAEETAAETGVVYEKSEETAASTAKTYAPNTELINKLKADADARTAQLRSLVEQLLTKQGNAYGAATDMWQFLASGNFTVDAATKEQAQKDIAEDGYWGVEQTSDRILDFAKALSGNNPDKIEEMREAFKKGFEEATGAWGKDLPDISQKTYDAVMAKFDKWAEEANKTAAPEAADTTATADGTVTKTAATDVTQSQI